MEGFVKVATVDELPPGGMKAVEVGDETILLANVGGTFYAVTDVCTHAECSLADGYMEGSGVECPCHGSAFDVTTGAVLSPPAYESLKVYKAKAEGSDVLVGPA